MAKDITDEVTNEFPELALSLPSPEINLGFVEKERNGPEYFKELMLMQLVFVRNAFDEERGKVESIAWDYCVVRFGEANIYLCVNVEEIEYE